jgi:hypothetical protein
MMDSMVKGKVAFGASRRAWEEMRMALSTMVDDTL